MSAFSRATLMLLAVVVTALAGAGVAVAVIAPAAKTDRSGPPHSRAARAPVASPTAASQPPARSTGRAARSLTHAQSRSKPKRSRRPVVARVTGLSGHRFYVKRHRRLVRLHVGARIFQHEFLVLGPATQARLKLQLNRRSPISDTANVLYITRFHTAGTPKVSTITPDWGLIGFGAKLRHHLLIAPRLLQIGP